MIGHCDSLRVACIWHWRCFAHRSAGDERRFAAVSLRFARFDAIFGFIPGAGVAWRGLSEDIDLSFSADATRVADTRPPLGGTPEDTSSDALLAHILSVLDDMKAEEVVQIDLRGKTTIGDYMVVASGRSSRQVSAIAERVVESVKQDLGRPARVEGKEAGDWVLIDTGDVLVHLFRPEVRDFYQLEKMWLTGAAPSAPTSGTAPSSGSAAS